jgi:membrane-associated phospholipid phosphatase
MNGIPSDHSQTVWAVATVVLLLVLRLSRERVAGSCKVKAGLALVAAAFLAGAATVAASRVLVHAHFVSDVIVGSAVGVVATLALARRLLRPHPFEHAA